jgi:hypothetical protein
VLTSYGVRTAAAAAAAGAIGVTLVKQDKYKQNASSICRSAAESSRWWKNCQRRTEGQRLAPIERGKAATFTLLSQLSL